MTALKCISSMATRQVLGALCRQWSGTRGLPVDLESVGGVDAARRIDAGEAFDVAVLADDALAALERAGRVRRAVPLAVSSVAIASRPGSAPPVASVDQLVEAVRSCRAVGYSTGPSGKALLAFLDRRGLLDAVRERLVLAPPGVPVGELVARGQVDLGFQQRSELLHCDGITLLGSMPPGAEIDTVFSAAPCSASLRPDDADALIAYLRSPAAAGVIRSEGMEPAPA